MRDFIYQKRHRGCDIRQGDLLGRTARLEDLVGNAVPGYDLTDCRGFLVLTQSCDLVRRQGKCAAKYVTLSMVRRVEDAVTSELRYHQSDVERQGGFISDREWSTFEGFVDRLLNNNADGFFFLREEQRYRVTEHLCAFLPLTVTLPLTLEPKGRCSYSSCLGARLVGVSEVFQAKLGWLVGNMYSRVGTPDFSDADNPRWESIRETVKKVSVWRVPRAAHEKLVESLVGEPPPGGVTVESVRQRHSELELHRSRKGRAVDRVEKILSDCGMDESALSTVVNRLQKDQELSRILK